MFLIKGEKSNYAINAPTSLEELNANVLSKIVDNVRIPEHYCIVTLCFKVKPFDVAINALTEKNKVIGVIPLLAKIYEEDANKLHAKIGDKVIIERSTLERATHLHVNLSVDSNKIRTYFENNPGLRKEFIEGRYGKDTKAPMNKSLAVNQYPEIYLLEFKILPAMDIRASIDVNEDVVDIFKVMND